MTMGRTGFDSVKSQLLALPVREPVQRNALDRLRLIPQSAKLALVG
jgi:hypothetical protein